MTQFITSYPPQVISFTGLGEDEVTPETLCEQFKPLKDVHEKCMKFNNRLLTAGPEQNALLMKKMEAATKSCENKTPFEAWAKCYYVELEGAWYEKPIYLGGAVLAGAVALGLVVLAVRKSNASAWE